MPRRSKAKGFYRRGPYWLDWDKRKDGSLRSPFLAIFWYDPDKGRIRSVSTGTADERGGTKALDRHFLKESTCPTCGQPLPREAEDYFVTDAIADYLALKDDGTIEDRLAHVVEYIGTLDSQAILCSQVNEAWMQAFRKWSVRQPVLHKWKKDGNIVTRVRKKPRAPSTTENSVIQLAAAINAAHGRGVIAHPPLFRPIQTKELNRTPKRRLSIEEMATAFRYALEPKKQRTNLHRFLMAAVATVARPDAVHDISTKPARDQWHSASRVLALNHRGRRQTKKYRATVRVPWQFALRLDECDGFFVPVKSVASAHASMCEALGWPQDGEGGLKLWRRSVAQMLRNPARQVPAEQIELQLGHRRLDSTSDLYAAFDPAYLAQATAALEAIIDEIEARAPGAFHRTNTGETPTVVPIVAAKNA